ALFSSHLAVALNAVTFKAVGIGRGGSYLNVFLGGGRKHVRVSTLPVTTTVFPSWAFASSRNAFLSPKWRPHLVSSTLIVQDCTTCPPGVESRDGEVDAFMPENALHLRLDVRLLALGRLSCGLLQLLE